MTDKDEKQAPLDLQIAEAVQAAIIDVIGPGYHPDTTAMQYTQYPGITYDQIMDAIRLTFQTHGLDIAEHALETSSYRLWSVNALVHFNETRVLQAYTEREAIERGRDLFETLFPGNVHVDVQSAELLP